MKYEKHTNKGSGSNPANEDAQFPNNPAVMQLSDGGLIEVHHWFYDDQGRVALYFEDRNTGINAQFHDANVEFILESLAGATHALDMSVEQLREEVQNP